MMSKANSTAAAPVCLFVATRCLFVAKYRLFILVKLIIIVSNHHYARVYHCTSTGTRGPTLPPGTPNEAQGLEAELASPRASNTTLVGPLIGLSISTQA